ncbi:hypothetical protein MOQ_000609 [Trypanosoma cruzi marinkellei]|uniref:Uncharacterized protein n=1 Tax=Trypanosoma cruzi marinkellei TaxID=85056 RepID=K2NVY8_TRYCR|nr:hypothetical protein MOQ_000609 [Trypanosoma cruzi marinkellei]
MSGKKQSKLKVTVYDEMKKRVVYETKETWPSGRKMALPPGDYCVHAELVLPRLDGSTILLDAVKTQYSIVQRSGSTLSTPTALSGQMVREELASCASHVQRLSPYSTEGAIALAARADLADGGELATRLGSFPPSRRSMSEFNGRASVNAESVAGEDAASVWRSPSRGTPNPALQRIRDPTPAQALRAFSELPSKRATPSLARVHLHAYETAEPNSQFSLPQRNISLTAHPYAPSEASNDGDTAPAAFNPEPQNATSWLWKLSPTPVKEEKVMKSSPGSVYAAAIDEPNSRQMNFEETPLVSTPPQHQQQQQQSDYPADSARGSVHTPLHYEPIVLPYCNEDVGVRPANAINSPDRLHADDQAVPLWYSLPTENIEEKKNTLTCRETTPLFVHAEPIRNKENEKISSLPKQPNAEKEQQTSHSVIPTSTNESSADIVKYTPPVTIKDNRDKSPNRGSVQPTSPHLPSRKEGPTFVVPPPDVINVHEPFCLALAFGSPSAAAMTTPVFLHVLVEEEVEPGVKPVEPVISVVPATLAAVPTRARGINYRWVCSPSIRANGRTGVMELLGGVAGKPHTAIAISTVCVGPSCDGQTLSGIQFVLDNVERISSCQFFVSFREIEEMSNEEEEVTQEEASVNEDDNNGDAATAQDKSRQTPTLDDRALGAEVIYNSLPYIRCVVDENGEMVLEVQRKNFVVACEPVQKGSRVAMYFGTIANNGKATGGNVGGQQPYLSVLVDYRTVFRYVVPFGKVPEALRVIMMSSVKSSTDATDSGACMRLREVELLSQQRRLVAFADEVCLDGAKASQISDSIRRKQQEEGPSQHGAGRPGSVSAWVAGQNPGYAHGVV